MSDLLPGSLRHLGLREPESLGQSDMANRELVVIAILIPRGTALRELSGRDIKVAIPIFRIDLRISELWSRRSRSGRRFRSGLRFRGASRFFRGRFRGAFDARTLKSF